MDGFLLQASFYLAAAVIAVPLAARLGLGSVLGYLIAGVAIGFIPAVGSHTEELQHFAEFGVVMMLFLIGLELEPRALWDMRRKLVGLGGAQVILTTGAITVCANLLGLPWSTAFAVGMIFALSSTAIVLQTLSEKRLMQTQGGRSTFSVLLTQDIAVIPMLALLPLLAFGASTVTMSADGSIIRAELEDPHHTMSLVEGLPGWGVTLVTLAAVVAVILTGIYLTRPVFRYIHHARLREMYTATALLIVVGTAVLMSMVGLSPALGTFLAGVVLANSEFRHEIETDLEPFKGLLLGLFFITVGAGINFETLWRDPGNILALTLALMIVKGLILFGLATISRLRGRDRWLFALGLAQAGEFGFVLTSFALSQGVVGVGLSERLLLIVALSMLITPLFFILYEQLSKRGAQSADADNTHDEIDESGPIIIAGIGRFGQVVNRLVRGAGFATIALDNDLDQITTMRRFGTPGFFGDPSRPDVLAKAGLMEASVLVVCVEDRATALRIVRYARRVRPDIHIIARAYDRVHVYQMYQAGANDIVREMFDSSLRAGRYALEQMGLTGFEASEAEMAFYHADRANVRELAEVWKPGVPVAKNAAYVARAKELNSDLETAIVTRTSKARDTKEEPARPGFQTKDALD